MAGIPVAELRKLKAMLNEGIIAKEEFLEARNRLLEEGTSEGGNELIEKTEDNSKTVSNQTIETVKKSEYDLLVEAKEKRDRELMAIYEHNEAVRNRKQK